MHLLDDAGFVVRNDPSGMYRFTAEYPKQCREALAIAQKANLPNCGPIRNVVLSGLGGSAAGGDFVRCLFDAQGSVPFIVNRDYHVPNFVDEHTLVIASSYSGNTEETLSAYAEAKQRKATVVVVTSGGKLAALAETNGDALVRIPGGQPPRTAMGFMFVPVVSVCERLGLLPEQPLAHVFARLEACVREWGVDTPFEENEAKRLGEYFHNACGVLYGLGGYQGAVANRWKGQINENAKNMIAINAFPELNHNEILGWVKAGEQPVGKWRTLILQDGSESAKMQTRAAVTTRLIEGVSEVRSVTVGGDSLLEKMLAMVFLGDFVSLYLAALNDVDPENIDAINVLKAELSKVD